jgi:phosphatidylglycerol:prolipoprotein diacylglycerol transferase
MAFFVMGAAMIQWNVSPTIVHLGPLQLRWYGLMFLAGFMIAYQGMRKICLWENKPTDRLDSMLTHVFLGTLIGARLGHCLFYEPGHYLANPLEIFKIWEGGLASHGGGAGVLIALWLFSRKNPEFPLMWIFDRCAIFTVLTGALIRIGNLMNSEIIGRPTDVPWSFVFERVDKLPRHPTQIYESLCYFIIAGLGWWTYRKYKSKLPPGRIFGLTVGLIFVARFVIEFFKENQESFESSMPVNMGQLLSIPFMLVGAYFFLRSYKEGLKAKTRK